MPNGSKSAVAIYSNNVTPEKLKKILSSVKENIDDRTGVATFLDANCSVLPANQTPTKATTPGKREYDEYTDFYINDNVKKRKIRFFMPNENNPLAQCPRVVINKGHLERAKKILNFDNPVNKLGEFPLSEIPPAKRKIPRAKLQQQNDVMEGLSAREVMTIAKMLEKNPELEKCDDAQLKKLSEEINFTQEAHHSHGHAVTLTPNHIDPQVATNMPSATSATNFSSKRVEAAVKLLVKEGKYPNATFSGLSECKPNPKPGTVFAGGYMPVAHKYLYHIKLNDRVITLELAADRKTLISRSIKLLTKKTVDVYFEDVNKTVSSPQNKR